MKIQIKKTYNESFHNVRSHKKEWMRVAYGPFLIWALGALILGMAFVSGGHTAELHSMFTGDSVPPQESSAFLTLAHFIYSITYFISMLSLTINGFRYAALQEGGRSLITLNLNKRFVKIILYYLLVGILSALYLGISAGIIYGFHVLFDSIAVDVILGILLGFYGIYLVFRITLYPVLISLDQDEPLRTSWNLMRGNVWRFIGLMILIGLTILGIGIIGAIILGLITALFAMVSPMLGILTLVLWLLFAIFMVLFAWAVNSKAMALIFEELSKKGKKDLLKG